MVQWSTAPLLNDKRLHEPHFEAYSSVLLFSDVANEYVYLVHVCPDPLHFSIGRVVFISSSITRVISPLATYVARLLISMLAAYL